MSGYRCVNYYELCRLCTKSSGTKVNIFSEEGKKLKLYHKITESLPVSIDQKDKLPKIICEQCQQHVESIADFRETCINAENMLRGCLNSSKLRTGGKVYIKDVITKKAALPPPSSPPSVTIAKTTISATSSSSNLQSTTNNDFLSSIIQAVGIQQMDDVPEIIQQAPQQISTPQYTLTLDGQALKSNQIQYKIEEPTITYNTNEQTQTNYSQVDEFLKLNVKKTIPIKKEVKPPNIKVKVEIPKNKKPNLNLVITPPKQQQHPQIVQQQQIQQQHHQISTPVTSQPHRIVLPLKFTDGAGEHQVVTQIDAKNLVLPTTYFQMKLPPQFTTVDGQRVVHITPSQMPSISLTPTSIQNIQQSQHQHLQHHQNTQTISVSSSTNTTPTTYHMTTTPTTPTPTFRITTQPTINTSSTTTNQQQTQTISMPTLQLSNFSAQTASSIQKQLSHNNIQIHVKHEPQQQQQQQQQQQIQQQQIHVPVSISVPSTPPKLQTVTAVITTPTKIIKQEPSPLPIVSTTLATTTTSTPNTNTNTSPSSSTSCPSSSATTCDTCGKTFKRKEHLAQHMKLHIGLRPFKCEESGCTKAFSRKEHLMRHIVSHTGKKMFSCDVCQKLFSRKDNLNKHRRTHPNEATSLNASNFICNICNKGFAVKMYYLEHKAMHEMETDEIKYTIKAEHQEKPTKIITETTGTATVLQNQTQLMEIQIPTSMATSQTVTINSINSNQLKSMGSHDTAVLTLPSNLTNLVSLNHHYVTSTGEMVSHLRIDNN